MKKYILVLFVFTLLFVFGASSVKAETASCSTFTTTLKMGMNSSEVRCLQQMLNSNGFQVSSTGAGSLGSETNYFGAKTRVALKAFQASQTLSADGIFGPMSRVSLLSRNGNGNGNGNVSLKTGCSSTLGFSSATGLPCNNVKPLDITVYSPAVNAVWMTGNSYNINWTTSPSMRMSPSKVTITLNGPHPACLDANPACAVKMMAPYTIVSEIIDTGSYVWTIPQSISENYRGSMQITVTRNDPQQTVGRSAVFSIIAPSSSIRFTSPTSMGNKWKVGETYEVAWSVNSLSTSSMIELGLIDVDYNSTASVASSLVWGPITMANQSPYKFTVPKNLRTGTYRFLLKHGNEYVNSDDFSIVNSNLAPTILFSASPSSILIGNSSTLKWEATNAISCVLDEGPAKVFNVGSSIVYPKTTTTFKIVCAGPGGSVSSSATVFVNSLSTTSQSITINQSGSYSMRVKEYDIAQGSYSWFVKFPLVLQRSVNAGSSLIPELANNTSLAIGDGILIISGNTIEEKVVINKNTNGVTLNSPLLNSFGSGSKVYEIWKGQKYSGHVEPGNETVLGQFTAGSQLSEIGVITQWWGRTYGPHWIGEPDYYYLTKTNSTSWNLKLDDGVHYDWYSRNDPSSYNDGEFEIFLSSVDTINVSSPKQGDQWYSGKTYTIKWNALPTISTAAAPATVKITISNPGCLSTDTVACIMQYIEPYVIAQNAPNNGSYTWTVPNNLATSVVNSFNNFGNQQITVALNGTDKSGTSDTFSVVKTGTNNPPVISGVSGPVSLNVNQTGTWTVNTLSTANQGNLSYTVDWDDPYFDLPYPSSSISSSIQQTATFSHAYSRAGTYIPTFTVTNQNGQSAQTSLSVKVNGTTPIVCDYPAPPQGCNYIQGSNYNPTTQCGMVLSCPSTDSGSGLSANVLDGFNSATNSNLQTNSNINNTPVSSCEVTMTLMKGMTNSEVKCLQQILNAKGFKIAGTEEGKETTYFGLATLAAVKAFQTSNNLVADGIFGSMSRMTLKTTAQ